MLFCNYPDVMKLIIKTYYFFEFTIFYIYKLILANLQITWDILTPAMHLQPTVLRVPLYLDTNLGLLLFTNLLCMTPGSLVIDMSPDRKTLVVHVISRSKSENILKDINAIQRRIFRLTH